VDLPRTWDRHCYIGKKDTTLFSFSALLDTLTGVLGDVFGRVSDIAQKMLAHDAMSISVISEDAGLVRIREGAPGEAARVGGPATAHKMDTPFETSFAPLA
jgi:hypothetical protein